MTTCSRASDSSSTGPWPGRSPTSRRSGHRLGGRSPRRWPSTGSRPASSSTALAASVAAGNAAAEVLAVAERARPLRAGAGPVGSGGRPRDGRRRRTTRPARTCGRGRQRGRRARSRHPLRRCRHRRAGARPPPRRTLLGLLCERKALVPRAGRPPGRVAGVDRARRGARAARTADPGTRPRPGRARPCSGDRAGALRGGIPGRDSRARGGAPSRCPQAGGRRPHRPWYLSPHDEHRSRGGDPRVRAGARHRPRDRRRRGDRATGTPTSPTH